MVAGETEKWKRAGSTQELLRHRVWFVLFCFRYSEMLCLLMHPSQMLITPMHCVDPRDRVCSETSVVARMHGVVAARLQARLLFLKCCPSDLMRLGLSLACSFQNRLCGPASKSERSTYVHLPSVGIEEKAVTASFYTASEAPI